MSNYKRLFDKDVCCKCGFNKVLSVGLFIIDGRYYCKQCKDSRVESMRTN